MTAERFLPRKTGAWKNTFAHLKEGAGGWFILSFLENLQCFPASAGQSDQSGHCTESFSWLITVGLKVFALHFISFYPSPHSAVENSFNLMKIQRKMKNDYVSMLLTVSRTNSSWYYCVIQAETATFPRLVIFVNVCENNIGPLWCYSKRVCSGNEK